MKKGKHTEEQIIGVLKQVEAGRTVKEVARELGVSEATIYTWKSKYGGMEVSEARRLKELEDENRRHNAELRSKLLVLARQKPRYSYRRLCALLERSGCQASPQRVYRRSKRCGAIEWLRAGLPSARVDEGTQQAASDA